MIELLVRNGTVDVSEDDPVKHTRLDGNIRLLKRVVDAYLNVFLDIYLDCAKRQGITPVNHRTLLSHGISKGDKYVYSDLDEEGKIVYYPVQGWVDKHSGKHDALFIAVCNRENYQIMPDDSLVIWPASEFDTDPYGMMFDDVSFGIFLPENIGLFNVSQPKSKSRPVLAPE